jgi:hypothetical protein
VPYLLESDYDDSATVSILRATTFLRAACIRSEMTSPRRQSSADGGHLVVGAFVNASFLAVLVFFAYLREQPLFWTSAGNWPIWLRELVGASFYPLLLLELLLLIIFSATCVRIVSAGYRTTTSAVLVLPFLWIFFIMILLIVGGNNLENLTTGQPLHWHPR